MPIRKELAHFYGADWKKQIRPRILKRDQNRCTNCGKPNHATVRQIVDRAARRMWWFEFDPQTIVIILRDQHGRIVGVVDELPPLDSYSVRIVLTIAHLNHDPSDMRDENLAALCQWCHLNHELRHHAETRAIRKDQSRPILVAAEDKAHA